jgi:hypothetical protein
MSQPEPQAPTDRPRWTAVSIALFIIGLLILIPASLCTVLVAVEEGDQDVVLLVAAVGAVPVAAGIALIYAALKIRPGASQAMGMPGQSAPRWTGASIALFVLGLLILLPSGLCTAVLGVSALAEGLATTDLSALFAVLFVGGVPAAIGAALVYAALRIRART